MLAAGGYTLTRISVVIPTLDEADRLPALIEALRREPELAEIVVADGCSGDGTAELAARLGTRVVTTERGRGQALRTGAALAIGEILLFLHADSSFPKGGLCALCAALDRDPRVPGGNFRVLFDGTGRFARGLTVAYPWLRVATLYYGDSGIFVRRAVYEAIGGIRPIPLMEDYDFVRRLERAGPTCRIEEPPLTTSARKFTGRRAGAIVSGWVIVHVLYWLGVSPERLARLYYPRGWRDSGQTNHGERDHHGD
jgi:rSAM/selenodomain-associated transferase 2